MAAGDRQAPRVWTDADIRRLRLVSARLVTGLFVGEYRSAFRGRGIEFGEVREYQPGDDFRSIDWNVTARSGRPFVKQYVEEREMTVMLLLDLSASMNFVSPRGSKAALAAEIAALLAFAATRSNDRVGLLTFSDRVERYMPPGKGPRHAQRLVADLQRPAPGSRRTDLGVALGYLERVQRRGAIVFLISDFLAADYSLPLAALARRHDVVAVAVTDDFDSELPGVGLLQVADLETGERHLIDCADAATRLAYLRQAQQRQFEMGRVLREAGAERLVVHTGSAPDRVLAQFFHGRLRRRGR